jgi:hypothetical protein
MLWLLGKDLRKNANGKSRISDHFEFVGQPADVRGSRRMPFQSVMAVLASSPAEDPIVKPHDEKATYQDQLVEPYLWHAAKLISSTPRSS